MAFKMRGGMKGLSKKREGLGRSVMPNTGKSASKPHMDRMEVDGSSSEDVLESEGDSDEHDESEEEDMTDALMGGKRRRIDESQQHDGAESEEDQEEEEAFIRSLMPLNTHPQAQKQRKEKEREKEKEGYSFAALGISPALVKALHQRHLTIPTPIQRATIPKILPPSAIVPGENTKETVMAGEGGRDVVGMARTGSGKTLAYLLPLLDRLRRHEKRFGVRAVVLAPNRELALQILKVAKDLSKAFFKNLQRVAAKRAEVSGRPSALAEAEDLRFGVVVGGESLDEQFSMVADNPDVIIATPGRLLHLAVEMNLDLKAVQYIVFDEADRLFEMGFSLQLQEIIHRLPATRQSVLFSATLPKSLVEFAKAGLTDPKLIRLDAESKISEDLQCHFFSVKADDKESALICLLKEVINIPFPEPGSQVDVLDDLSDLEDAPEAPPAQKGKRKFGAQKRKPAEKAVPLALANLLPHQTLIFCATKHHVEYIGALLRAVGWTVALIYGSLDQSARRLELERFRRGISSILVVTDVAARGIDLPVLEHVVNYDLPASSKVFVHRVGRTARAGRTGSAYTFVTNAELPYFVDLQTFLNRPFLPYERHLEAYSPNTSIIFGTFPRSVLDSENEHQRAVLYTKDSSLPVLKTVAAKGQGLYEKTQTRPSLETFKRAKVIAKGGAHGLVSTGTEDATVHPLLKHMIGGSEEDVVANGQRIALLNSINTFRPSETIFEVGARGNKQGAQIMASRKVFAAKSVRKPSASSTTAAQTDVDVGSHRRPKILDQEFAEVFESAPSNKSGSKSFQDPEFCLSYIQKDSADTKAYSIQEGSGFVQQASHVAFDLANDDGASSHIQKASQITWDRKKRKFIKGGGIGADNKKLIKTESGARLPATFRSGKFDEWKAKQHKSIPRLGELEKARPRTQSSQDGRSFRHNKVQAPKPLDPTKIGFERKERQQKARARDQAQGDQPTHKGGRTLGRFSETRNTDGVLGIKSVDQIRKDRAIKEQRRAKNARPSHKGKARGGGSGASRGSQGARISGAPRAGGGVRGGRGGARGGRGGSRGGRGGRGRS